MKPVMLIPMKPLHLPPALRAWVGLVALAVWLSPAAHAQRTTITVQAGAPGKPISPDLVGIFFEDLSWAADGGLYAELVQNRSFEYSSADRQGWHPLVAWETVELAGAKGTLAVDDKEPLNAANTQYAVLSVEQGGGGMGLRNLGFDGIPVKAGDKYNLSFFARQLDGTGGPLAVRLETPAGAVLAEATLPAPRPDWTKAAAVLQPKQDAGDARLVVLAKARGRVGLDMVSLFPEKTFKNRPNGLRTDLAQTIADLQPGFVRFPGGCLVHGDGLGNLYRWKDTIGPLEQRRGQPNIWRYHQSVGLGYFEYFQFCEDIGAKPLPVVPAGVCCQNSGAPHRNKWGEGQQGLPLDQMPAYIQDVLDLVEWANGPATSTWGAKRAAAGHPEPFGLKYLGVGNEDRITPVFRERFEMIHKAVKAKHPEIVVVGTVGPFPDGEDYDNGWRIANELQLEMVDEHYYKPPQWFWDNLQRYDGYDRSKAKVYVGEYAAHDDKRRRTLRAAIAEAAGLTGFERNGDVVSFASYAPLLARHGRTNWDPDLIYFNATQVFPTISYHVQRLFGRNSGDSYLATAVGDPGKPATLAASTVRDSRSGDVILKIVNGAGKARPLRIEFAGIRSLRGKATKTVLAGPDPDAVNEDNKPPAVRPESSPIAVAPAFDYEAPANSLTVIRISAR